jgi:hypothetical protein
MFERGGKTCILVPEALFSIPNGSQENRLLKERIYDPINEILINELQIIQNKLGIDVGQLNNAWVTDTVKNEEEIVKKHLAGSFQFHGGAEKPYIFKESSTHWGPDTRFSSPEQFWTEQYIGQHHEDVKWGAYCALLAYTKGYITEEEIKTQKNNVLGYLSIWQLNKEHDDRKYFAKEFGQNMDATNDINTSEEGNIAIRLKKKDKPDAVIYSHKAAIKHNLQLKATLEIRFESKWERLARLETRLKAVNRAILGFEVAEKEEVINILVQIIVAATKAKKGGESLWTKPETGLRATIGKSMCIERRIVWETKKFTKKQLEDYLKSEPGSRLKYMMKLVIGFVAVHDLGLVEIDEQNGMQFVDKTESTAIQERCQLFRGRTTKGIRSNTAALMRKSTIMEDKFFNVPSAARSIYNSGPDMDLVIVTINVELFKKSKPKELFEHLIARMKQKNQTPDIIGVTEWPKDTYSSFELEGYYRACVAKTGKECSNVVFVREGLGPGKQEDILVPMVQKTYKEKIQNQTIKDYNLKS